MAVNFNNYRQILSELKPFNASLVAVSKTKPVQDIQALYKEGQRIFGENYVQELMEKEGLLPKDIQWHFIGHLQSNKVKYIAPFVSMIHGVDSLKLLTEINKQAAKHNRVISCLLQVFIATEETKFGLDETELTALLENAAALKNVHIAGLMGMASNTDDEARIRQEFSGLKALHEKVRSSGLVDPEYFKELSTGMSGDFKLALAEGSTLVRIGSLLFGVRNYA